MPGTQRTRGFDLDRIDAALAHGHPGARFDLTRPVASELVVACVAEAVQQTTVEQATVGRPERWRWLIVDDPEVRAALAALHVAGEPDELDEVVSAAPVLVVPCQLGRPEPSHHQRDLSSFYCDVVPAITTFTQVARRHGLVTAWSTRHLRREADAAGLLGVPRSATQIALIPVGVAAGGRAVDAGANPFDPATAHANRWGA